MAKRDYYDILGVSKNASADEIKKAHRKLVRKLHPDVNKNNADTDKFKEVQEAYDVLSDSDKRAKYDQFGHAGMGAGGVPPGGDPFEAFRRAGGSQHWRGGQNVEVEDFNFGGGGGAGMADIFEQLFGGRGGAGTRTGRTRARPEAPRGADVEYPVTLTFEQAARGTTLPLQINRGGKLETIEIKVPAGVKDGSRVRIKGQGEKSYGEAGDLYIITSIRAHPYFRREGLDIYVDLPISLYEAMLGTKVDVPTLDGKVTLTIPPGTSSGAKLRLKGHGIERGTEKGDQFVVTKVIVPKGLDDDAKGAIERLQKDYPIDARKDVAW